MPKFIVRLCMDALLEVLGFGDRRRLIKLERIGQRYHQMIEHFFKEAPFIRISPCFKAFRLVFLDVVYIFSLTSFYSIARNMSHRVVPIFAEKYILKTDSQKNSPFLKIYIPIDSVWVLMHYPPPDFQFFSVLRGFRSR